MLLAKYQSAQMNNCTKMINKEFEYEIQERLEIVKLFSHKKKAGE